MRFFRRKSRVDTPVGRRPLCYVFPPRKDGVQAEAAVFERQPYDLDAILAGHLPELDLSLQQLTGRRRRKAVLENQAKEIIKGINGLRDRIGGQKP